jgi:hypothetical protein
VSYKNKKDDGETIVETELIVEQFDKYINSKVIDYELKSMKTTQWYMIDRIREKWNDLKRGK